MNGHSLSGLWIRLGVVLANAKASPERGLDEESGEAGDDLLGCTWATEACVVSSPSSEWAQKAGVEGWLQGTWPEQLHGALSLV